MGSAKWRDRLCEWLRTSKRNEIGDLTEPHYRLRLTRSWRISSELVITRLLAWKPRWATISPVHSSARSTLDISSAPALSTPRPPVPAWPTIALPELSPPLKELLPAFSSPPGLLNEAIASWPIAWRRPLL